MLIALEFSITIEKIEQEFLIICELVREDFVQGEFCSRIPTQFVQFHDRVTI